MKIQAFRLQALKGARSQLQSAVAVQKQVLQRDPHEGQRFDGLQVVVGHVEPLQAL